MRRRIAVALLIPVLPVLQVTLVNRLPFPAPDLALVLAIGAALALGTGWGAATGFAAGLLTDLVPPSDGTIGRTAFVLCVVGLFCGWAAADRPLPWKAAAAVVGVLCALGLETGLGMLLGDPRMTWPAIEPLLPLSLLGGAVAVPLVLGLAYLLGARAAGPGERETAR
ncbi:rod shape-determining protein MreD [Thermocatellispora tengchongensis]|uniref:Rod shape-determining protein MreD n=1 Tax=Thermocatellispora tengchongensis TaxID=1073253 RepID=A0A840P9Q5_9ACTN|nr:rod shape-determining protein MreD [Thermocatellispora tengchongensis]MBB5138114.1 rod shape-determining protein MreD [Thermocatellispora tengchongensis]